MALKPDKAETFANNLQRAGRIVYEDAQTGVTSSIELIRVRILEGHVIAYLIRKPGCPFKQSQTCINRDYIHEEGSYAFLPHLGEHGAYLRP